MRRRRARAVERGRRLQGVRRLVPGRAELAAGAARPRLRAADAAVERFAYKGAPVYGFDTTSVGAPTDGFGRLIYLDTFNSTYGPGWRRENSFVPHNPTGVFCYGFYTFDPTKGGYQHPPGDTAMRGPGTGEKYRLTAAGPGVTPNVAVIVPGLHPYDAANASDVGWQRAQSQLLAAWGDKSCKAGSFTP